MIQGTTSNYGQQTSQREGDLQNPTDKLMEYFKEYARQKPEVVALWALGIGFVLGWKLKPW